MNDVRQLDLTPRPSVEPSPTRYELVVPPGFTPRRMAWLALGAILTAMVTRMGILSVLKYIALLVTTTAVLAAILTATLIM